MPPPILSFWVSLLKPGIQKNPFLLETGHEDSFCLCGNFLLAIRSRGQPILLQDLNNEGLKQRRLTQLGKGCWRSGLLP